MTVLQFIFSCKSALSLREELAILLVTYAFAITQFHEKAANLSVKHRMHWPVIEQTGTVCHKRNQVEIKLHHMAQPTF